MLAANGDRYDGVWVCGKRQGRGVQKFCSLGERYVGCFFKDERHGYGTHYYSSGIKYFGNWKQGNRHGKGTCEFPEGVYSGAWFDDRKEGFGTFEFSNGDTYEGEWLKDWRHGRGKCSYHTGEVYDGEWVDDMRKGEGDETIPRNLDEEDAKMATTGSLSGTLRVFPEPARPRVPDASP